MGDANAAIPVLQKGATLDPDSKAIQQVRLHRNWSKINTFQLLIFKFCNIQLLSKCIMKARRDARNEKDFYKKMMGQAQKIDNSKQLLNEAVQDVPKV